MTAYAYVSLTIKALLRSEEIHPVDAHVYWKTFEKILAFPAFYFGVDPLTGLIINAALWAWGISKILSLLLLAIKKGLNG